MWVYWITHVKQRIDLDGTSVYNLIINAYNGYIDDVCIHHVTIYASS